MFCFEDSAFSEVLSDFFDQLKQSKKSQSEKPSRKEILDAWIMVEYLSEGNLDKGSSNLKPLSDMSEDYYAHFKDILKNNKTSKTSGILLYLDVFNFKDVISILRKLSASDVPPEEPRYTNKFTCALVFDSSLALNVEQTFFTTSAYIRQTKNVPSREELLIHEAGLKHFLESYFDEVPPTTSINEETPDEAEERAAKFNQAMRLTLKRLECDLTRSYVKFVANIETDSINLHSFFIGDLEKAKKLNTKHLREYLSDQSGRRFILNSDNTSVFFNSELLEDILQPKNYPLGRFPSNVQYPHSLMQQVAVNLALGYDTKQMRSVNGPPGTGKTTLLCDIFANLTVQQAYIISKWRKQELNAQASYTDSDDESHKIAILPKLVSERNIIVASSNNSAVQNIVKELPLITKIDKSLQKKLLEVDYFIDIANSATKEESATWGLFSLEGGKSSNMQKLKEILEKVVDNLEGSYVSQPNIYVDFKRQYLKVKRYRKKIQKLSKKGAVGFRELPHHSKPYLVTLPYSDFQLQNPWFDEEYRKLQSELFILGLAVRKQFLYDNRNHLKSALSIWDTQNFQISSGQKEFVSIAWDWMNFTIPVIGSTFASFSRMCGNLPENSLGHLFIDEAGQALPQAAVGAIFRSSHIMAVGDPSQIKPVLTLEEQVLSFLSKKFKVNATYLSENASVQTLIDRASQYGFYKNPSEKSSWVGIPLWVHRRCLDPMFSISNAISYDGLMVQANKALGHVAWYDVKGKAQDKFVEEQGDYLYALLSSMMKKNSNTPNEVFVITPFRNVATKLSKKLDEIGFTRRDEKTGKATNIGTIHTFQGKEAPIVFLVLGADENSEGAARWAVREPNMLNVAATRAREAFYIIGDRSLYESLNNNVIRTTIETIDRYSDSHQESQSNLPIDANLDTDVRMQGVVKTVSFTRNGSGYAYLRGDDGIEYTINQTLYAQIKEADRFLRKGTRVAFRKPQAKNKGNKNIYLTDADIFPIENGTSSIDE